MTPECFPINCYISITSERCIPMSKSMSVLSTLLLFALANATFGQSSTATLQGLVTDPTGAAIPGAEVSITDLATNITRRDRKSVV